MNYIELINRLWQSHEAEQLSTTEIALYFYLVKIFNYCHWADSIKRLNVKINADLNITYPTMCKARNRLKQVGLIDFKTQNGNSNTTYTLKKFLKVTNEVSDEVTSEVGSEVTNEVSDEINKTETKQNNKKNETKKIVSVEVVISDPEILDLLKVDLEPPPPNDSPKPLRKPRKKVAQKKEFSNMNFVVPEFREAFARWIGYKADRKESYKSEDSATLCYRKLVELSGGNPDTAMKVVEQAMANNWAGLFELKTKKDGNRSKSSERVVIPRTTDGYDSTI